MNLTAEVVCLTVHRDTELKYQIQTGGYGRQLKGARLTDAAAEMVHCVFAEKRTR